ncbi:MAG: carboxylesterase family protein [Bacteroidales bacterium]|nr:carboxylesterase family protein [Bacteroidales bacterium]
MKKITFLAAAASAALVCSCAGQGNGNESGMTVQNMYDRVCVTDESTIAHTVYGDIQGYKDGAIFTFKGIQYAKAERFMPPVAPDKHEGVLKCRNYGPKAPQTQTFAWDGNPQTDYAFGNQFIREPMDEKDCLVLNVWTKGINDGKKRPVFVWIHGGGYSSGSGHDLPCYEGRALAEKGDIVTITLNHRLNLLGYCDLTALGGPFANSVNLGMQDIVKALEWVKDNIAYFGGDPDNVTIGGQSGGAGKVSTLLAMPSAHGLFHKAIIQSGSTLTHALPETTQPVGLAFAKALGVTAANPSKVNDYTYEELLQIYSSVTTEGRSPMSGLRLIGSPVVDGNILPRHPFSPDAPEISKDIPVIIGTDFNEFSFENPPISMDEALVELKAKFGDRTDSFIETFKKVYPNKTPREMLAIDLSFTPGAIKQSCLKSEQGGAKVFSYLFTWQPKTNYLAASHGMELPFMFNNVMLQPEMTGNTPDAHVLENIMSSYWISFIKTGDPNTAGLPTWEPFTTDHQATMIFDDECRIRVNDENVLSLYGDYGRPLF